MAPRRAPARGAPRGPRPPLAPQIRGPGRAGAARSGARNERERIHRGAPARPDHVAEIHGLRHSRRAKQPGAVREAARSGAGREIHGQTRAGRRERRRAQAPPARGGRARLGGADPDAGRAGHGRRGTTWGREGPPERRLLAGKEPGGYSRSSTARSGRPNVSSTGRRRSGCSRRGGARPWARSRGRAGVFPRGSARSRGAPGRRGPWRARASS